MRAEAGREHLNGACDSITSVVAAVATRQCAARSDDAIKFVAFSVNRPGAAGLRLPGPTRSPSLTNKSKRFDFLVTLIRLIQPPWNTKLKTTKIKTC